MQTTEDRIRRHYRSLKKSGVCCGWSYHSMGEVFMVLARRWERPIVEIKAIVNYKGAAGRPVVHKTPEHNRINRFVFWSEVNRGRGETTARIHDREEMRNL